MPNSIRVVTATIEALLCVKDVASMTGFSEWWVREHAEELGGWQDCKRGRLRFSRLTVMAYMERKIAETKNASAVKPLEFPKIQRLK